MIDNNTGTVVVLEPYQLKNHIKDLKRALKISEGYDTQIVFYEGNEVQISSNSMIHRDYY